MPRHLGLTLAEIMLTLGLMSVISLVIIGLFSRLLLTSKKSSQATTANLLAQSIMDRAVREGPPNWGKGTDYTVNGGKASLYTTEEKKKTEYVFEIHHDPVLDDAKMGELWKLQVVVSWWTDTPDSQAGRANMGRMSRELTRTVYVRGRTDT